MKLLFALLCLCTVIAARKLYINKSFGQISHQEEPLSFELYRGNEWAIWHDVQITINGQHWIKGRPDYLSIMDGVSGSIYCNIFSGSSVNATDIYDVCSTPSSSIGAIPSKYYHHSKYDRPYINVMEKLDMQCGLPRDYTMMMNTGTGVFINCTTRTDNPYFLYSIKAFSVLITAVVHD